MKLRKLWAVFTCLALLCGLLPLSIGTVAATNTNLVVNGDFESGNTDGWNVFESTAVSAEAAHSGNYGVVTQGPGNWNSLLTQRIPAEANTT